jgi:hypothetical protein
LCAAKLVTALALRKNAHYTISKSLHIHLSVGTLQIHKWQQLWCPIEERYYETEGAMRIHFREDLGFIPRTLPLAAIAAAGVVETLDQQVSAVLLHCCY